MGKPEDYRQRAAEYEALARLMSRHDHRDHLLELAAAWQALAEAAELEDQGQGQR